MNISGLAIRQPVTVAVGVLLVLMTGYIAVQRIPIQLTPNVEDTIVTVMTMWEGASPQEIEQDVIDRQEEKLQGIANLKSITSESQQSQGTIRLEFAVGISKEQALREVSDKLREVPVYPANVDEPVISASDPESQDYIAWIVFSTTDPDLDIRTLKDFAEDRIESVLERVPGISEVNVLGGREREVQIRFDPVRLAQRRITLAALVSAIRRTNRNISAGQLQDGKLDIRLRTLGQYTSVEEVETTVIEKTVAGPVFIRDVAEVVETYKEPSSFVRSKGKPVIAINAQKEVGANVMEVMEALQAEIARLNEPGGVLDAEARARGLKGKLALEQVYDQTMYIHDALDLVENNIWLGGSLAMLVLFLFLRSLRTAGLIAGAIPISVVGAVVVMVALGRTVNVISLAGMAFAVGMVVDNAIVVLENIYRHLEMGKSTFKASYDGEREVWGAVLASTLTTIMVFIPILLVEEEAGQLFRDIALAICAAVALSLLVSITVIPTTAARLLRPLGNKKKKPGLLARDLGLIFWPIRKIPDGLSRLVYFMCGSVLARLAVVVCLTLLSLVGTYWLLPPFDYLPTGNRNMIFGIMNTPSGYSLEQQSDLGHRVEATIRPFWEAAERESGDPELPEIPTFDMQKMAPGPPVVPPPLENYFLVGWGGMMFHGGISENPSRAVDMIPLFQHAARSDVMPGVLAYAFQYPLFALGGHTGSAVKVNFSGPGLDEVSRVAKEFFMELMKSYPFSVQPDPNNFDLPGPEVQVIPGRVRLAEVGLAPEDIGLAVQASGDGAIIGEYRIGGQNIDLKLIARDAVEQEDIDGLGHLPIATPTGRVVPLGSLARLERVGTPSQINRVGRQRSVTLQFTPPPGLPLEQAIQEIDTMIESKRSAGAIPPRVETSYTGSASKLKAVQTAMLGDGTFTGTLNSSLVLALIVVYLLMCVLFQSFLSPLVICFSVPLATLGGFAALRGVHFWSTLNPYMPVQNLDVLTMLGFLLLIGVVVNNAILIVHQALNFMRDEGGTLEPRKAIAEAVRTRVRPIFMSMFTSVGGMSPLVFMPGSGSELYRGLGSVVIGGLIVSTLFTLVLVPLLFSLVTDLQNKMGWLRPGGGREAALSATKAAGLLLVVAALAGCSVFGPDRDDGDLEEMLTEIIRQEVKAEDLKAPGWKPPEKGSEVSAALKERLPELEKIAGPASYGGETPRLGVDLDGRKQDTVTLRLEQAVAAAVQHNLGIQLKRIDPDIAREGRVAADSEFDSVLFATFDFEKLDQPTRVPVINGLKLGVPFSASETERLQGGIRKRFVSGTTLELQALLERLENDTPGFDFQPDPAYNARLGLVVKQPLLRGFGTRVNQANIQLSENEARRTVHTLKAEMLTVIAATEQAYWDLVFAVRNLLIQQRLVARGRTVKAVLGARQAFDVRKAEYSDAVATVNQREADLLRAQRLVKLTSDRLKFLMNDPGFPLEGEALLEPLDVLSENPLRVIPADAIRIALSERPEVKAAVLAIDDARVRERVAKNLTLPELSVTASIHYTGMDDTVGRAVKDIDGETFVDYLVGLTFEVPIGNRGARAEARRAGLRKDRSLVACRKVFKEVILEVKNALRTVQTGYELILASRAFRIAQTENLRALLAEEKENRALTPEFLNLKFTRQERLALAEQQEMGALADFNKALADYYRAIGTGHEAMRIELKDEKAGGRFLEKP